MRDKGCIEWSKKFLSPYYCNNSKITHVCASADSNYYVVTNDIELAKLDKKGNLLWNKRYQWDDQTVMGFANIFSDPQGALYGVSGAFNNGWTVTKLDRDGNVIWNKFHRLSYDQPGGPDQSEFMIPSGGIWLNGKIYVCGNAYSKANSTYFSFITKLDAVSGAKEWQYGYNDPDYPGAVGFVHLTLYDTLLMASSGAQGQTVTLIDSKGAVRKSIKTQFGSSYGPKITRAGADSNGHIHMMQWTEETLPLQPYFWYATNFAEIDTSLNKYGSVVVAEYSRSFFADATIGRNNKFAAVGQNFGYVDDGAYGSRDFGFVNIDTVTSQQACFNNGNDYTVVEKTVNRLNFQYQIDSSIRIIKGESTPFTLADAFIQSRYTCPDYIDSCSFMKVTGPVSLCNFSDTYTYRMHRNKKCILAPQWQLPAGIKIIEQTDSTLSVKFPGFGIYNISASLNSCIPVKDSLIINIVSKSHPLNIGKDTTICPGSTITLDASGDFLFYVWNDGSTKSTLHVTQPGTQWVEVIDSCGNRMRDSILISSFNNGIDIGPDRTSCANDTLHLNAPGGFMTYEWSNNYNANTTNTQNIIVHPAMDTAYYIKAEKIQGCFAYDTVRIKVNRAPSIQLGADKSFCQGDSIVLDAGNGFAQYQWSNGSVSQQAALYTAGNYSVIGTAANGCKSYDTLRIADVWTNPIVSLDHNSNLCTGSTRTLQPGAWSAYVWHDGSTSPSFNVSRVGTYYVTVTDTHQCKGSDTVKILQLISVPSDFLPSDTAICSYGELTLMANRSFPKYLWNNGQTSASITVTKPGLYWLAVTDLNLCSAKDSVIVSLKQCLSGFFMPTAFTPNGDNLNDVFKPLIFGDLVDFELKIYNRFGEVIFFSRNVSNGWDGTVKGVRRMRVILSGFVNINSVNNPRSLNPAILF